MLIQVSELKGLALNWVVATCEGWGHLRPNPHRFNADLIMSDGRGDIQYLKDLDYSTRWSLGGCVIEREFLDLTPWPNESERDMRWSCDQREGGTLCRQYGPTPLVAAIRCHVASKLGDVVDIPDQLCELLGLAIEEERQSRKKPGFH